jgi:hypothetical protein
MTTMSNVQSKVQQLRELEAALAEITAKRDLLKPQVDTQLEVFAEIVKTCEEKGISRRDMALELCPELAKGFREQATGDKKTRRARTVKVYKNPHNGEIIETKGGNHKALKAWKEQYGAATVESWLANAA